LVGPIEFTPEEIEFAQKVNDGYPGTNSDYIDDRLEYLKPPAEIAALYDKFRDQPLVGINLPALDENIVSTGSTDVGDLSQIVPVSMLGTACWSTGVTGHSWGNVACAGMSIGHKGMIHAAKIMAIAAMEVYSNPEHLTKIREEFELRNGGKPYIPPIPEGINPPYYEPSED
jgi:aminobenzoyl-glutamate utilization protein B